MRFDEALPDAVKLVVEIFGKEVVESSVFVRDATGYVSVVVAKELSEAERSNAENQFKKVLQAYCRSERAVVGREASGAEDLLREGHKTTPILAGGFRVRLLDRRIVGSDWLHSPAPKTTGLPVLVFSSIKGGVGRSTALSVLCAYLSKKGKRVLAIDCDLEAPGIGAMLLKEEELPKFGTLDYLVENGISGIDDLFMADATADSFLGSNGARVTVMPAIGKVTLDNPGDALAKISRAYLEDITAEGIAVSLTDQLRGLVDRFSARGEHDVILVDARAGLHEMTASVILGLGADLLLFGVDEPQTYVGYRLLFGHLARFPSNPEDDWRDRIHFVQAKAPKESAAADEKFGLILDQIYPPEPSVEPEKLGEADFVLEWKDEDLAGSESERNLVVHVFANSAFEAFDPVRNRIILDSSSYEGPYNEILSLVDILLSEETK